MMLDIIANDLISCIVRALKPQNAPERAARDKALSILAARHGDIMRGVSAVDAFRVKLLCDRLRNVAFADTRYSPERCLHGAVLVIERLMHDGKITVTYAQQDCVLIAVDALGKFYDDDPMAVAVRDKIFDFLRGEGILSAGVSHFPVAVSAPVSGVMA